MTRIVATSLCALLMAASLATWLTIAGASLSGGHPAAAPRALAIDEARSQEKEDA